MKQNKLLIILLFILSFFLIMIITARIVEKEFDESKNENNVILEIKPPIEETDFPSITNATTVVEKIELNAITLSDKVEITDITKEIEVGTIVEDNIMIEPADPETWGKAAEYMAKALYGEDPHGTKTHQAAVYWVILNRVDSTTWFSNQNTPQAVVSAGGQFIGYSKWHPVVQEYYDLALDVIGRWLAEKDGIEDVGRVLPSDYMWFTGNGRINRFRNKDLGGSVWDWSLESPYE